MKNCLGDEEYYLIRDGVLDALFALWKCETNIPAKHALANAYLTLKCREFHSQQSLAERWAPEDTHAEDTHATP